MPKKRAREADGQNASPDKRQKQTHNEEDDELELLSDVDITAKRLSQGQYSCFFDLSRC
jgi:hypothetical protein